MVSAPSFCCNTVLNRANVANFAPMAEVKSNKLQRALRWLRRFRHRRGYGIHSPFAFGFVTGVVYEKGEYYPYSHIRTYYNTMRARPACLRLKDCKLLFRLANFQHPARCLITAFGSAESAEYVMYNLREACASACYTAEAGEPADMIVCGTEWPARVDQLAESLREGGMMVVTHVGGCNRGAWLKLLQHPKAQVTFDLYDFGIVCYRSELQRQHYVINYF